MAKGSMMLQIAVEQVLPTAVSSAPEIWAVAVDSLDGERTTVREIATEKSHQFFGCPPKILKAAVSGRIAPPAPVGGSVRLHDDRGFAKQIRAAARRNATRT
ncbi:MAG: hypothetical protein KF814_11765 [Nitrospiraceae bacterium]|nr:hypothetical protein [Nitrospiraceae bacterium]